MNIRLKAEEAVQLFEQHIEEEQPIIDNGTGEEFIPKDDEEFVQCYDPLHPVRKSFPTRWFMSKYGNLLSVTKSGIKRLPPYYKPDDTAKRYGYHMFQIWDSGKFKTKNIKDHIMAAMIFGSAVYGNTAKENIQEKGIRAWEDNENATHHESKKQEDYVNPETLETVGQSVHHLLTRVEKDMRSVEPKYTSQSKDVLANISFMQELSELACKEAPDKMTLFFTGETINIKTGEVRFDGLTKIEEHELPKRIELTDDSDNSDNT